MTSQINPNNIDGQYPVAGQPNNTQGFRDNFTNIKTNFQTAATEITDLENKGVFKAALTGTTLDNNMDNNLIYAVKLNDVSYTYLQQTATAGAIAIDYAAAQYQLVAPAANVSLSFSNWPTSGDEGIVYVDFYVTNTAYTVTLPAAVSVGTTGIQGYAANVITFGANGTYRFGFSTVDAGTTIAIYDLNRALNYYTNTVNVAATNASTSTTSGALIVAGGVGVAGNLYVGGDIYGNVSITDLTIANVSASGNVTGGNILTAGIISATGTITTAGNISLTGNIVDTGPLWINTSANGNINLNVNGTGQTNIPTGVLSVTGNIQGGNLQTVGLISATGTVTGSSHLGAVVSVTGNVTGGNIISSGAISSVGNARILSGTAVPAGGTAGAGYLMSSTANLGVFFGSGAPTLSAAQGSLYLRTDSSTTNTRMYVNTDGSTTWTSVITVA